MKFGRVFPKNALGLFSIRREIRHTLARDNYIDIDVENCHPVLLYQICLHNQIECKYLKRYIDNRTELLNDVMTKYNVNKDAAKQLFIQLLYFGTFNSWCENHSISNNEPIKFHEIEDNFMCAFHIMNSPEKRKEIDKYMYENRDENKKINSVNLYKFFRDNKKYF